MAKHLFTSLIKCTNCNHNYRFISDRKIPKYICNGYSIKAKNGCTTRYTITEDELLYIIYIFCNRNHIQLEYTNEFMTSIINVIYVDNKKDSIIIEYKNGEQGIYSIKKIQI